MKQKKKDEKRKKGRERGEREREDGMHPVEAIKFYCTS